LQRILDDLERQDHSVADGLLGEALRGTRLDPSDGRLAARKPKGPMASHRKETDTKHLKILPPQIMAKSFWILSWGR